MNKDYYIESLRRMLKLRRFEHSLRSAETAEHLAMRYGADSRNAWLAGLLHDISRGQDEQTIREWALLDKGSLSAYDQEHFNVLHSYASAWYCRKKLGIHDPSVLDAIRYHTTGSPGMDLVAKVVFAADYLEPGRDHLTEEEAESLTSLPVDEMILAILERTEAYLAEKNIPIAPESRELYRELSKR